MATLANPAVPKTSPPFLVAQCPAKENPKIKTPRSAPPHNGELRIIFLWRARHKKKNWLFVGHPEAGWRSAVIYSIIVSCRRRGIDPWDYVRDVLKRLPGMKQSELPSLLPRCWKPAS
jgi:IS66 C-terminal element